MGLWYFSFAQVQGSTFDYRSHFSGFGQDKLAFNSDIQMLVNIFFESVSSSLTSFTVLEVPNMAAFSHCSPDRLMNKTVGSSHVFKMVSHNSLW